MRDRIKVLNIISSHLKGNPLEDTYEREIAIYLPPTYFEGQKEYPVIYVLPGFSRNHLFLTQKNFLEKSLAELVEELIKNREIPEVVVVCIDCSTKYGGSQYINSIGSGNYADYFYMEVIPYIQENYKVKKEKTGRAIIGKSSGGYGALVSLITKPEIFTIAGVIAPDVGFEYCYLSFLPKCIEIYKKFGGISNFCNNYQNLYPKNADYMLALSLIAMANCYSPNLNNQFKLDFLCDDDNNFSYKIWEKWKKNDPLYLFDTFLSNIKLSKYITIKVGSHDEYNMHLGSRSLTAFLLKNKINHDFSEYDCEHSGSEYLFREILKQISCYLDIT